MSDHQEMYLITEYCRGPFYMGWHVYLRDNNKRQQRNSDGEWGWIRRPRENRELVRFLGSLEIEIRGDGTCDDDGLAEVARRFPIARQRIGGKRRGCIPVLVGRWGELSKRGESSI